jgi:hypothetical protein
MLAGQRAITAAQVKDSFARLWRKTVDDGHAEVRHKPGILGLLVRRTVLHVCMI